MKTLISDMNPATRYLYLEIADSPARTKRIYYALKNLRAQGVTRVRKRLADAVQSEIDSLLEDKIRLDHINRLVTDDMLAKGGPTGTSSYNVYQMASRFINDYDNAEPPLMPVRTNELSDEHQSLINQEGEAEARAERQERAELWKS